MSGNISKIKLPNGDVKDIKDASAVKTITINGSSTGVTPSGTNVDLTIPDIADIVTPIIDGKTKNKFFRQSTQEEEYSSQSVKMKWLSDGTITLSGTATGGQARFYIATGFVGSDFTPGDVLSGVPNIVIGITLSIQLAVNPYTKYANDTGSGGTVPSSLDPSSPYRFILTIEEGTNVDDVIIKPMLCSKIDWGYSNAFVPYASTNYAVYEQQQFNIGAISSLIDEGAKNKFYKPADQPSSKTDGYITLAWNADGTFDLSGSTSSSSNSTFYLAEGIDGGEFTTGDILSGVPADNTYGLTLCIQLETSPYTKYANDIGLGARIPASVVTGSTYRIVIVIPKSTSIGSGGVTVKPMICSRGLFDFSTEYKQYIPSNKELMTETQTLSSSIDILSTIVTPISETEYAQLTVKDKPIYFIYET